MKKRHSINSAFMSLAAIFVSVILLCSCSVNFEQSFKSEETDFLKVHFLDVGQGDSIFIELPDKKTMLIDTGENYHGEGIINYIENCGYSKIDYLVATHPHSDHIGSMSYIVRHTRIENVYMPKVAANTKTYKNLLESISDKGLKITSAKAGLNIADENDYKIDVAAPTKIDSDNLNNCSAVIKLTYKDNSFLFTGDAEKDELSQIKSDISADVLKVGHHGSSTSTNKSILKKVNPDYAVISVGKNNDYGHPHESTLKLLKDFNCKIYRTDIDATVVFTSDGKSITVKTNEQSIKKAG